MKILFIAAALFLAGCITQSDPLNAPDSQHDKTLKASASYIASSAVVIRENAKNPALIEKEAGVILSVTGQPTPKDLQEARERASKPKPDTYTAAQGKGDGLRSKTLETAKNNTSDVLRVENSKAENARKRDRDWVCYGLASVLLIAGGIFTWLAVKSSQKPILGTISFICSGVMFFLPSILDVNWLPEIFGFMIVALIGCGILSWLRKRS